MLLGPLRATDISNSRAKARSLRFSKAPEDEPDTRRRRSFNNILEKADECERILLRSCQMDSYI